MFQLPDCSSVHSRYNVPVLDFSSLLYYVVLESTVARQFNKVSSKLSAQGVADLTAGRKLSRKYLDQAIHNAHNASVIKQYNLVPVKTVTLCDWEDNSLATLASH